MRSATGHFPKLYAVTACLTLQALSMHCFAAEGRDCRSIDNNAERLACYDQLNAPPAPPTNQVEVPVAPVPVSKPLETPTVVAPPPADEPAVLDDTVGRERIAERKGEQAALRVSGHVNGCREDRSGKYRFYFENGQIWQQKDNKRISWRECDFDVTIEKDFFGYKMLPLGEKRTIRISRIK